MKKYKLFGGQADTHTPDHPERTASKQGHGLDFDVRYQVWPNRPSMARSIRMQEKRERRQDDWTACVPLSTIEGY